jgi:signal transduction histidine kinase
MLPVTGILTSEGEFVSLLILTTLTIAFLASLGGGYYVHSRIRPLWKLTAAAHEMGQGNLSKPITTPSTISEIRMLATVLEHSRTRLQQTLKELSLAKEWSEALIQSISEGIITLETNGKIRFFSEGAGRITRLSPAEALEKNINTLFSTLEGSPFTDFMPPEGGRRNVSVGTPHGETVTLMITRARRAEDDQITIVIHDITEETQRRNLQTYFLANISHEFRTPLAGMKVSIELLLENARDLSAAELNELLNSLYLSVGSLQNLIDNLLESSKIEANHFSLRRQPIQVNHAVSEALRLIQPFLNRRHQFISLDQPLMLPTVNADATRLTQVLVNLLSNASKYSPMNSAIDIVMDIRSNALYVAVSDRGQGIPEEQRENVFRQFVRLGRETKSDYSAGLGLAVVKAMIEAHGGQVGVDHRAGGGAIFWFMLPLEGVTRHESTCR